MQITHITYSKTITHSCGNSETYSANAVIQPHQEDITTSYTELKKAVEAATGRKARKDEDHPNDGNGH